MSGQEDIIWAAWCLVSTLTEMEHRLGETSWHGDLVYLRRLLEFNGFAVNTSHHETHELAVA